MHITLYILTFLLCSIYACKPHTETVINEIVVLDTVYVNQNDTVKDELGGLKIRFAYLDEFGFGSRIISGTEVKIPNIDNVNISEMNAKGEVYIDGLISGRTYGIDVFHKGNFYTRLETATIGSNTYLDYGSLLKLIDVSKSEIQSVSSSISNNPGDLGISFTGASSGIIEDDSSTHRGIVVFLSKWKNVSITDNDFSVALATDNRNVNGNHEVNLRVQEVLITVVVGVSVGDTLYYAAHGITGSQNQTNGTVGRANANPKGIKGWIIYEN